MATSLPSSGMRNMRDFFTRDKDKLPAELKRALTLLQLSSLDALEERLLATDAFLIPWAVFRDSIFLLQPDAMPRATSIATTDTDKGISRTDLLWFYTQFDEGVRRYDPRANKYSVEYTPDSSVYGVIDKSKWGVEGYEKHLFAWLLQVFRVGKAHNPWGFDFFELRSVCSACEEILVPIVNVVRASYDVKGRRYYGRLALYIEERCPSGLAFPKDNVSVPEGSLMSPTPYRVISMPRKTIGFNGATFHQHTGSVGVLTRKHYDETEKELRDVYPQYGGLVERPKFKVKMDEWLAEQRARAELRKAAERAGETESFQPQLVKRDGSRSPVKQGSPVKVNKRQGKDGSESPIKRYSDSIRRSLSRGISKKASKEEPKSPLHGVTRRLYIPDDAPTPRPPLFQDPSSTERDASAASFESSDTTIITPWPRAETQRKPSEQSVQIVYSSIRNSNPFDLSDELQSQHMQANTNDAVFSPMGPLSAIPQPLQGTKERTEAMLSLPSVREQKSYADMRNPSYEGSGWEDEISMTKLQTVRKHAVRTPEAVRLEKPPTRLPVPIKPAPYAGPLRVASKDSPRKTPSSLPKPVGWPSAAPPKPVAWPGIKALNESTPPIPSKSPDRWNSIRGHVSGSRPHHLIREESDHSLTRIVSKENIRTALGAISRDSSAEDLTLPSSLPTLHDPSQTFSPGGTKLQTYNMNLFPRKDERKGTPVEGWVGTDRSRYAAGGPYEMAVLKATKRQEGEAARANGDADKVDDKHGHGS